MSIKGPGCLPWLLFFRYYSIKCRFCYMFWKVGESHKKTFVYYANALYLCFVIETITFKHLTK